MVRNGSVKLARRHGERTTRLNRRRHPVPPNDRLRPRRKSGHGRCAIRGQLRLLRAPDRSVERRSYIHAAQTTAVVRGRRAWQLRRRIDSGPHRRHPARSWGNSTDRLTTSRLRRTISSGMRLRRSASVDSDFGNLAGPGNEVNASPVGLNCNGGIATRKTRRFEGEQDSQTVAAESGEPSISIEC